MLYLAAVLIVTSVALFVAAPLGGGPLPAGRAGRDAAEAERLERERGLAMQGLRELEFDREMGKLSGADYASLRESLMARALGATAALDRLNAKIAPGAAAAGFTTHTAQAPALRPRPIRSATAPRVRCSKCGGKVLGKKFCSECGEPLWTSACAAACAER